jgi:outer membrane protein insertion porin family
VQVPGVPATLAKVGEFTGIGGSNPVQLPRSFTSIGGDTQLLANVEYRIPLYTDKLSAALFGDIGTAFNIRSKRDQTFSSNFLDDQPFLGTVGFVRCPRASAAGAAPETGFALTSLSTLAACNGSQRLALTGNNGLVMRDNRLVTSAELQNQLSLGPFDPLTGLPFGFQQVFLRGQAQTNTAVRLSQSLFSRFGDYRASLGAEIRIQVPVINVPFRLIFAYNPNARKDQIIDGFPFFFNEKKRVMRFSIGRTF